MKNEHDRFGIPEENLAAVQKWKGQKKKKYAFHVYVPTRGEVAKMPPDELKGILIGWMCHTPIEIVPSRSQIEEVRLALLDRADADAFTDLINMCRNYIAYS